MTSAKIKRLLIFDIGKLKRIQKLKPSNTVTTITVRVALLVFSAFLLILIDLNLVSCEPHEDEHGCSPEIQIYPLNDAYFQKGPEIPMHYILADWDYQGNFRLIPADKNGSIGLGCSSNKPVSWEFQGYQHEEYLERVVKRVIIDQYPTDDENETDHNKQTFCYHAAIDIVSSPIFGGNGYTCTHMSDPLSATRKSVYFYGSNDSQVQFIKPSGSTVLRVESVSADEVIVPCRGNHPNISNDAVKLTKEISPGEYQKLNEKFETSYNPKKGFTITPSTSDSSGVFIESLYGRYKCSGLENGTVEAVFSKTDLSKMENVQERSAELTVDLEYDKSENIQWFVCSLNSSSSSSELNPANFSVHFVPCKNPAHCQLILKYLHNLSVDSPKLSEGKVSTFYEAHSRKLKWNARAPVSKMAGSLPAAGFIICRTRNKLKYQYAQFFKTVDENLPEHLIYEDQNSMQLSKINLPPPYALEKSLDIVPSSVIQIKLHLVDKTGQNSEWNLADVTMNVSCTVSSFMFAKKSVELLVQHSNGKNSFAKINYASEKYFTDGTMEVEFLIEDKPQDISSVICRAPTWNSGEWVSHSISIDFKEKTNNFFSNMMTASPEETVPWFNTYVSEIPAIEIKMKPVKKCLDLSPVPYSQEQLDGATMNISCRLSSFIFAHGSQQLSFEYSNSTITETPADIIHNYTIDSRFTNDMIFLVNNSRVNISSIICFAPVQNSREMVKLKYNVSLPIIISASASNVVVHDTHSNFRIFCEVGGTPSGKVEWYHNKKIYEGLPDNSKGFYNKSRDTSKHELFFNQTTVNFSSMKGIYTCNATNFIGTVLHDVCIDVIYDVLFCPWFDDHYFFTNLITILAPWESHWMYSLIAVGILSCCVIVALLLWLYMYKKSINALKDDFIELGKDYYDGFKRHFADDDDETRTRLLTNVQTNVGFVRALQKHYNQSKLTIKEKHLIKYNDTPIKSGNFGKIYRAKLIKGKLKKKVTEVVVKESINRKPGDAIDLLAEFKTLVYVGEQGHPNIVRLLGAVVNFRKRNFQIVLEWCENGSLKDFLEENRNNYSETRRDFASLPHASNIPDSSATSTEGSDARNTITREDLIRWSFELACGMEHLASLQLVHADLAIRNLLLTKERVLKITDFGFSKMLRQYDEFYTPGPNSTHHQKQFPWRTLAVECTNATMLSTKSDVWAYGVTLWEIFSLGQVPYASTATAAAVERALRRGVRLMRPTYATNRIYKVMRLCWCHNPRDRPEFSSLVATFKDILSAVANEEENSSLVAGEPQQQQELGLNPDQDSVRYVKVSILSGAGGGGGDDNSYVDRASPEEPTISDYVV